MNVSITKIDALPLRGKFKVSINGGRYISIKEASEVLGIHPETLRKKIKENMDPVLLNQ